MIRSFDGLLRLCLVLLGSLCAAGTVQAQLLYGLQTPKPTPPKLPSHGIRGFTVPDEPAHPEPAATDFRDAKYNVSFHVPAGWEFERKDGLLSTYGVEIHSVRKPDVRGVAAINFNPWPPTTFASAIFYYSVLPRVKADACGAQTRTGKVKPLLEAEIAGVSFHHGHEQHGQVCTEVRDEIFTAMRGQSCLRFDLLVNTFCAETSGAMEISADQLKDVDQRLAGILGSVRIETR